jgi:hypothetical protein
MVTSAAVEGIVHDVVLTPDAGTSTRLRDPAEGGRHHGHRGLADHRELERIPTGKGPHGMALIPPRQ